MDIKPWHVVSIVTVVAIVVFLVIVVRAFLGGLRGDERHRHRRSSHR
ncbi:hypothetical protein [Oerskovia jenensis]